MLKVDRLYKSFDGKQILRGLSFSVEKGELLMVRGASGSGKSTLLNIVAGLDKPDSGTVTIADSVRIACVFQEDRLLPWYTALENVTLVGAEKRRAVECLEGLGLGGELDKYPDELSGGMQRRLALARAFAFGGDFFLIDEPFRALDDDTADSVYHFMQSELKGCTALIVTHSAFRFSDSLLEL